MLLSDRRLDAVFPQQREAVQRRLPLDRPIPFADHIAQRQVHHLQGRVLAGKSHPRLQGSPQTHVQRFDRVGRVDHLADFGREGKKRNHLQPLPAPQRRDGCIAAVPPGGECGQLLFGLFSGGRAVDPTSTAWRVISGAVRWLDIGVNLRGPRSYDPVLNRVQLDRC